MPRSAHRLNAFRTWLRRASVPVHALKEPACSKNANLIVVPLTHLFPFRTISRARSPPTDGEKVLGGPSRSVQKRGRAPVIAFFPEPRDSPRAAAAGERLRGVAMSVLSHR